MSKYCLPAIGPARHIRYIYRAGRLRSRGARFFTDVFFNYEANQTLGASSRAFKMLSRGLSRLDKEPGLASKKTKKRKKRSRKKRRSSLWPLALITTIIAGIIGFAPISHPKLSAVVEEAIGNAGDVSVGAVTIRVFKGISLEDVSVRKRLNSQAVLSIQVSRARLGYYPGKVATRRKAIKREIASFVRNVSRKGPAARAPDWVKSLSLHGLSFAATNDTDTLMHGSRGYAGIRAREGGGADMAFRMSRAVIRGWSLGRISCNVRLAGNKAVIQRFSAHAYGGKLDGDAEYDCAHGEIIAGQLRGKRIDLAKIYASREQAVGSIDGRASWKIRTDGARSKPDAIRARGTISLTNVRADSIPLLRTIVVSFAMPQLVSMRFDSLAGPVRVADGAVWCDSVRGAGDPIDIVVSGEIGSDGSLGLVADGAFDADYGDSLGAITWEAMLPIEDGGRTFRAAITGTFDHPRVTVDRSHTRRAVSTLFRSIGRSIGAAFSKKNRPPTN